MYCTKADLVERYGNDELIQLTDRAVPPSGVIDDAVVDRACTDATAIVDSYVRSSYVVPLSLVNIAVVKPWACMLARWLLHEDAHPEHVKYRYEAAIKGLRDIATGKVALPELPPLDGVHPAPIRTAAVPRMALPFPPRASCSTASASRARRWSLSPHDLPAHRCG